MLKMNCARRGGEVIVAVVVEVVVVGYFWWRSGGGGGGDRLCKGGSFKRCRSPIGKPRIYF